MSNVQFGTNVGLRKKRVYYEGSDTIYEGMALCYNQDTTDNILGWDKGNDEEDSTTAEGYQNEGKFLRVEKPATANLKFFAGFVCAGGWNGKTGPRWLDIYAPNGAVVPVRGTDSHTIGEKLYIVNGDYEVTNAPADASVPIGYAMETVDRSTTEGLLLAKTVVVGTKLEDTELTAGASSPSPLIWGGVDMDRLRNDWSYGFMYEDDFLGPIDVTTGDGWTITAVTTGSIAGVATEQGGVMLFDSAGNAAADDGVQAQLKNCMFKPAAGTKIYFEARVKMNDATDQYFIGLAGVDTTLIASGVIDDVVDKCGFFHHAASTDNKISTIVSRTSAEDATADVADNADDTYTTLGFVLDGLTSVKFYVNGALVETGTTTANLPNAVMCLSGVSQIEGTGADAEMSVDWVRIAQVGGRA